MILDCSQDGLIEAIVVCANLAPTKPAVAEALTLRSISSKEKNGRSYFIS